ncbi:Ig-like domain-containing protein [Thomasclavelia spiroformis]|uniref:Ig-like domain-containing protein n=1 Tax=Thomasclavelia spiroformis TaxID=29348 RepID=UPI00241E7190|nr:Ig-like domain-containing protein [Thomasclavelia spiroformis]MBS6114603.1 Ig-like domain-containing protein [Thomasclavelia spiroformis]
MNKKKKFKIIGIIALLLILVAGIIDYQDNLHPKLELKNNTLTVEYGDDVNSLLKDCIDTSIYENKDIIDEIKYSCKQIKDFDNVPVGKYTINYKYRDTEKTLKLIVQDTIAPKIALTKEINIFENDVISYDDYVEVSDLSKYKITIDDSKVNYNTAGTYVAKYTAKDKYGNINTIDIPVVVEELLLQSNSPTNITLNPNGTSKFEISTNCSSVITYSSSDPNVATVDNSGNIIAKSSGSTTITAYVKGKQISTNVVVSNPQPARNTRASNHHNNSSFNNDDISYTVYKTKTGDCYHRSGCRYLSRSCIPISKNNAVSEGLIACSVCNP